MGHSLVFKGVYHFRSIHGDSIRFPSKVPFPQLRHNLHEAGAKRGLFKTKRGRENFSGWKVGYGSSHPMGDAPETFVHLKS